MKFVDRDREMTRLNSLVERQAAGLVALWGRRRVGKTRLLTEWCGKCDGLYTVADQSAEAVQRRYFAEAVARRLPGFNEAEYGGWQPLLRRLSQDARTARWRGPLVLDEFPYLVASSATLPSILQNWVDQEASSGGLLVAVAGSSQRMMQGLLLDATAPLYGRALEAIELRPIPAGWMGDAMRFSGTLKIIQSYAVWGGVPRYWELAEPFGDDLDGAVDALVLDPLGPLHREPDRLLLEEMPPAVSLRPLLDVIGAGAHRLSEIAGRLGQAATSLARPMGRLVDLGLVQREVAFGESEKTTRRALYRVDDPFFRFWFRVVAPHRAALADSTAGARRQLWDRSKGTLTAEAWESLCRRAVPGLRGPSNAGNAAGFWMPARRWWRGTSPEWDIVSVSGDRSVSLVGEVKWSPEVFNDAELETMAQGILNRPLPPGLPGNVKRAVFVPRTESGSDVTRDGVWVVDGETVLKHLR